MRLPPAMSRRPSMVPISIASMGFHKWIWPSSVLQASCLPSGWYANVSTSWVCVSVSTLPLPSNTSQSRTVLSHDDDARISCKTDAQQEAWNPSPYSLWKTVSCEQFYIKANLHGQEKRTSHGLVPHGHSACPAIVLFSQTTQKSADKFSVKLWNSTSKYSTPKLIAIQLEAWTSCKFPFHTWRRKTVISCPLFLIQEHSYPQLDPGYLTTSTLQEFQAKRLRWYCGDKNVKRSLPPVSSQKSVTVPEKNQECLHIWLHHSGLQPMIQTGLE